jgi:predicted lipoprotein with Yx(FWY)xxD motif
MFKCAELLLLSTLAVAGAGSRTLPLVFEANVGQATPADVFLGRGPGYEIHFDRNGISLGHGPDIVRMDLKGSNSPRISGIQRQEGRANYLIGKRDHWITDVPLYGAVQYTGVYPGVDVVFYGHQGEIEYDFTLAPGASASTINLAFQGIDEMRIDGGDLVLQTGWGELRHRRPRIFQMSNGRRSEIAGRFVLRGKTEAGFEIEPYDPGGTLVIDPVMAYSTYIGGDGTDSAWAVAVDSVGAAYLVGETWPVNFPKTFRISTSGGNGDAFIIKLNPSGTSVLYATYFGGNARDSARGVAVDAAGNAYVTGFTNSPDFPVTAGAYRSPSLGQSDAFAIKVNASGSALVYSALIGGTGSDFATGIAIDPAGSAYIAGYTSSVAFPVTSAGLQKSFGGGLQDAFVAKLNPSGSGLIYSTYLGGAGSDVANGIAVDAVGEAYIVGYTDSTNFPTLSPIYAKAGGQGDAFVAKLTPAGNSLIFSTYLGGSLLDIATAVALDSSANVYVTGATLSANFPVTGGAFQTLNQGSYDAFVSKMDSQGTRILYSTYVGGEGSDQSSGIAVDANGVAYIAGFTYSARFSLQSPIQSATRGGQEAFAAAVGATGGSLLWSTYLGGAADDQAAGVALDTSGGVYVVGSTLSSDFPTTAAAYRTAHASGDGFLVKLASAPVAVPGVVSGTPTNATASPQTFVFTARDPDGFADIANVYFLVNGNSIIPQNTCHGYYSRATNGLYLFNDSLTAAFGPLTPGGSGSLQNSQCIVYGSGSSVVASGTDLILTMTLGSKGNYVNGKNVYLWVKDNEGHDTGWVQTGSWYLSVSQPPAVVSGTPTNATSSPQTFVFTARDPDGFADIGYVYFLVNGNSIIPQNTCHGYYSRATNGMYLFNDSLTAAFGPLTPGGSGSLQNSQCIVYGSGSSVVASGTDLILTMTFGSQGNYVNGKNVYLWVKDNEGHDTGWVQTGSWNLSVGQPPAVVSGTPSNATASPQTFVFTARDPDGFADIGYVYFLVNGNSIIPQNTCHGYYSRATNGIYLFNDSLTAAFGPLTPGGSGSLQNSQCIVYGSGSSVVASGTDLILTMTFGSQGNYVNGKKVYLWVKDNEGHDTGWVQTGSWNLSVGQPPAVVSGTPSNATASPQTFVFTARDPDGFADIAYVYFLVNGNPTIPQNTCHGYYSRATNGLYLFNDALTAAYGPLTPGSSGVLQNSQCLVYGSGSSVVASGTDLILTMTFGSQGNYVNGKNVYLWVKDNEGHDTGWVQTGSWNH